MVIYTDKVDKAYKMSMLPLVKMNPTYKQDKGLHVHEYEHIKQYFMLFFVVGLICTPFLHWVFSLLLATSSHDLLYTFSAKYRQWCEVQAFKAQLKVGGSINKAAKALSEDYELNISFNEAKRLLS